MFPMIVSVSSLLTLIKNLQNYNNGLAMVKFQNGSAHDSFTTGIKYVKGVHFLMFRVIRSVSSYCMIGVQSELKELTPYPGHSSFPTGKALYGANGHVYADGSSSDYGLGGYQAGDYVGCLLDMNKKCLVLSINGRAGKELPLADNGYYMVANVYYVGDSVEIMPQQCYHKSN